MSFFMITWAKFDDNDEIKNKWKSLLYVFENFETKKADMIQRF